MRLDGEERIDLGDRYLQGYQFIPQGWAMRDVCFAYDSTVDLESVESQPGELSIVVCSLRAMNQLYAGVELNIWKYMLDTQLKDERLRLHYRKIAPQICDRIRSHPDGRMIFQELYYSMVLPVAAAVDAYEPDIGVAICRNKMMELVEMYLCWQPGQ